MLHRAFSRIEKKKTKIGGARPYALAYKRLRAYIPNRTAIIQLYGKPVERAWRRRTESSARCAYTVEPNRERNRYTEKKQLVSEK